MNWLSRFLNMVDELKQHPEVQMLDFHTFPPVEYSQFDNLEKSNNIKFPQAVFDFYKKTNGLQLRWIFKNNEHVSSINDSLEQEVLAWDFFAKSFRWEDGGIMILPLEMVLEGNVIDAFSTDYNMVFTKEDFRLTISEDEHFSQNFFTTDFESYLEFLIAGKGLISRRSFFYDNASLFFEKKIDAISTPRLFWTEEKILDLDRAILKDKFPFCDQVRFFQSQINQVSLKMMAEGGGKISEKNLEEIISKHHEFLLEGGGSGEWKVIEIRGIVTAFLHTPKEIKLGEQANFERKNLTAVSFQNIELPYANFCAAFGEGVDFSNSDFEKSLFTDAFLSQANFSNTNLTGVDFSRSDLTYANFENANLTQTDFENCDLRGANFRNAKMSDASFVCAKIPTLLPNI